MFECPVECGDLVDQYADRPAIGNNVVHGHVGDVFTIPQTQDARTNQWAAREIEWKSGLLSDSVQDSGLAYRPFESAEIRDRERNLEARTDHSVWYAGHPS